MPLLYTDIVKAATHELMAGGLSIEQAENLAKKISRKFCTMRSGRMYRVPDMKSLKKQERDAQIIEDAKTLSMAELCKKYNLSDNAIYKITTETPSPEVPHGNNLEQ